MKLSQTKSNGHNQFGEIVPTLDQAAGRLAIGFDRDPRTDTPTEGTSSTLRGHRHSAGNALVFGAGSDGDRCAIDPQPDGRRYAACGDGVVAGVAEWIAHRIEVAHAA